MGSLLLGTLTGCNTDDSPEGREQETETGQQTTETEQQVTEPVRNVGVFLGSDESLVEWEKWFGRKVDYYSFALFHDTWADYRIDNWPLEVPIERLQDGREIVLSFEMFPPSQTEMTAVATGQHRAKYRQLASEMVDHGIGDAHIRFGWEFNGRWAADGAVGRPEIYTAAWRNVVSAMRGVDGAEFSFIWAPNIWRKQMAPTDAYPGDEWVTEIGLTMYDKGDYYPYPEQCDSNCVAERRRQTWQDILEGRQTYYGLNYWASFARNHGKPLVFPEYGVSSRTMQNAGGGDNPRFFEWFADWMSENSDVVAWHNIWGWVAGPHYLGPEELYETKEYTYMNDASEAFRQLFS
ncbi:glycosyl hydrolase [Halomicroarcula sp. GCM10025324]|uniref:glycosyl hydrolase n=1 Tax=Haloarcula TaxID=2237 RepID=UPI0023E75BCB|nr:glycosyl hydrolase [Halomicroarcula sp. ZS-22-S1]